MTLYKPSQFELWWSDTGRSRSLPAAFLFTDSSSTLQVRQQRQPVTSHGNSVSHAPLGTPVSFGTQHAAAAWVQLNLSVCGLKTLTCQDLQGFWLAGVMRQGQ